MSRAFRGWAVLLLLLLVGGGRVFAQATGTITVTGSEQAPGGSWDASSITISFNGFTETYQSGQYSSPASVAAWFGAAFSQDYYQYGLASGVAVNGTGQNVITFRLSNGQAFTPVVILDSNTSFTMAPSGFPASSGTADTGTVTLSVTGPNNVVSYFTTPYDEGSTETSVAAGLAQAVTSTSHPPVTATAVDNQLYLKATSGGPASDYPFALTTASNNPSVFGASGSFGESQTNGTLGGGANAGTGQQTIYSYSIPSYVSGSKPTGYDADGNIAGYTDSVMGSWSFGYDTLNRLQSSSVTSGTYAGLQTSWGYDPFGNRTSESFSGSSSASLPTASTTFYNANNRISSTSLGSAQYDASGDVTADNQNQYLYNGDGRVCAVRSLMFGTMTGYVYGADGTRVSTGTITTWGSCDPATNGYQAMKDSILGPSGGQLTETGVDANGNTAWAHTNVWLGGQLFATYDPEGLHFYLTDQTGSRRVQTDYEGVVEKTCANLPYGDGVTCGANPAEELFAGLERDSESGLDHATYREYSSTFGRWTSPDPYGGSYDWSNPQSLNRYAYVNGSPLAASDPSGLDFVPTFYLFFNNGAPVADLGDSALLDALLGDFAPFAYALDIFELGKDLGLWDTGPKFHGNVTASQTGKVVPSAPEQDGFANCGCIAGQGLFHSPEAQQTWGSANYGVETVTKWAIEAYSIPFTLGLGSVGEGVGSLGLEAGAEAALGGGTAAAAPGFGTTIFGNAMHAQFGDVLLEQTGTAAQDWIFAAPNAPGVDATYLGSQNIGFDAAELKPFGYSMDAVGNQIGSFATQPGTTSVWWYNANGIIGRAEMWLF